MYHRDLPNSFLLTNGIIYSYLTSCFQNPNHHTNHLFLTYISNLFFLPEVFLITCFDLGLFFLGAHQMSGFDSLISGFVRSISGIFLWILLHSNSYESTLKELDYLYST